MSRILDTVRQSLSWGERTPAPHFTKGLSRVEMMRRLLAKDGPCKPAPVVIPKRIPVILPPIKWPETPQPF